MGNDVEGARVKLSVGCCLTEGDDLFALKLIICDLLKLAEQLHQSMHVLCCC